MKEFFNKGITLIALIITIIVLLILAGVSIATLMGEGGILNKASKAKTQNEQSTIEEEIKLAYNSVQADNLINGLTLEEKADRIKKELQEQDEAVEVIVVEENLMITYKGYEITISNDGTIEIEDPSLGDKPTGTVTVLTTKENVEIVEIQVEAKTTQGTIVSIQAINGATEKEDERNTDTKKIFTVTKNGIYYFKIKASTGRTAILKSEKITNMLEIIEAESLLDGISKIDSSGIKKIKVIGGTENLTYPLRVIYSDTDLNLTSTGQADLAGLVKNDSTWTLGVNSDLNSNGIVLKVNGNLTIEGTLTTVGGSGSGPLGLYIYCTENLTNNGNISMTSKGTTSKTENVYLQKNGEEYIYIPKVGGSGSGVTVASFSAASMSYATGRKCASYGRNWRRLWSNARDRKRK